MTVPLPLEGLLVADFSRVLAGPLVTQTLAELGATVVKVEHPAGGDDTRAWGPPFAGDTATYFSAVNKGKRSIALDLKEAAGLEAARALVAQADVVVENFRPGVMDRLGLGFQDVAGLNPRAIYCSINGFGDRGEAAGMPGIDLLVQAMAGWMHVTGDPEGSPTKVGMAVADVVAGLYATIGILAALRQRSSDGEGRRVSVGLFQSALAGLVNLASGHLLAGDDPVRDGNRHPSIAPYQPVRASDRRFILAAANDRLFQLACEVLERADLAEDPRFATNADRRRNVASLIAGLEETLQQRTAEEWIEALTSAGVPAGPINSVGEAFDLAAGLGLDVVGEDASGFRGLRSPIRFDGAGLPLAAAPPGIDDDGETVREGLASGGPLVDWLRSHPRPDGIPPPGVK